MMASEAARKSFCSSSVISQPPLTIVAMLVTSMASRGQQFIGSDAGGGCENVTGWRKTVENFRRLATEACTVVGAFATHHPPKTPGPISFGTVVVSELVAAFSA
jgi:hypothetical protein